MKLKIPSFYQESLELSDVRGHRLFPNRRLIKRKKRRLFLENRVETLEIKLATSSDDEIVEPYNVTKNELESIYDYITES